MSALAATAVTTAFQLVQQRQQAKAQNAAARAQADSQTQQIQQAQKIRERQRRDQLRRVLAAQRAQFGARGLSRGGSADAVLKGLALDTERTIQDDRGLNDLRIADINRSLDLRRRRNLLELSSARRRSAFDLFGRGLKSISLLER